MKAKPWQLAVIALAVVAVGASTAYMLTQGGPDIPTRIMLVDVSTGQLYEWNMKAYRVALPAPDPSGSGEYRLIPAAKGADGKWTLTENARSMLRGITSKRDAVNAETGEVKTPSTDIKTYVPPGA